MHITKQQGTLPAQVTALLFCSLPYILPFKSWKSCRYTDCWMCVGGLIGGGKEMMEGSDVMSSFEIHECSVSGCIVGGGENIGAVIGDPGCALSVDCQSDMSIGETTPDAA